jgi:23S rRNA G2069 N7-methylase RlmK/C1962 C5-methylase RlmI
VQEPTRLTLAKGACAAVIDNGALSSLLLLPTTADSSNTAIKPAAERAIVKTCREALRVLKTGGVLLISSSAGVADSTHVCTHLARVFGVRGSDVQYKQSADNTQTGE